MWFRRGWFRPMFCYYDPWDDLLGLIIFPIILMFPLILGIFVALLGVIRIVLPIAVPVLIIAAIAKARKKREAKRRDYEDELYRMDLHKFHDDDAERLARKYEYQQKRRYF